MTKNLASELKTSLAQKQFTELFASWVRHGLKSLAARFGSSPTPTSTQGWSNHGIQFTEWQNKGNYQSRDLGKVDWSKEYWALSHPVRIVCTDGHYLKNYDTDEVIAVIDDRYKWYWGHDHIHVCNADWDGRTYPDSWPEGPTGGN